MKKHIATLCPTCGPDCCPVISLDEDLPKDQQIVITDDFGGKIHMSKDQFSALTELAKTGQLKV